LCLKATHRRGRDFDSGPRPASERAAERLAGHRGTVRAAGGPMATFGWASPHRAGTPRAESPGPADADMRAEPFSF
jgi:hypothetical protein